MTTIWIHTCSFLNILASLVPGISKQYIVLIIMMIVYLFALTYPTIFGRFTKEIDNIIHLACCITGVLNLAVLIFCFSTDIEYPIYTLIIMLFVFFASFFFCKYFNQRFITSKIQVLDRVAQSPDVFVRHFQSSFSTIIHACIGFSNGHESITTLHFLKMMNERWPYFSIPWVLLAKFSISLPNDLNQLQMIDENLQKLFYPTTEILTLHYQIQFILSRKEQNLTPEIRKKIEKTENLSSFARNNMANFWDCTYMGEK